MTKDALYTLEELAHTAHITPRAVRYYAAKGLLPGPQSRGRYALYGTAHLNRLRLIGQMKQALLPIAAMRDRMLSLTDAQVAALLTRSEWPARHSHSQTGDALTDVPPDTVGATLEEQAEAYQYILDALTARPNGEEIPAETAQSVPPSRRALFPRPVAEEEEKRRKGEKEIQETRDERREGEQSSIVNRQSSIELWRRILLAPGVELHVRGSETAGTQEKLERLIAEAKTLFDV